MLAGNWLFSVMLKTAMVREKIQGKIAIRGSKTCRCLDMMLWLIGTEGEERRVCFSQTGVTCLIPSPKLPRLQRLLK